MSFAQHLAKQGVRPGVTLASTIDADMFTVVAILEADPFGDARMVGTLRYGQQFAVYGDELSDWRLV